MTVIETEIENEILDADAENVNVIGSANSNVDVERLKTSNKIIVNQKVALVSNLIECLLLIPTILSVYPVTY